MASCNKVQKYIFFFKSLQYICSEESSIFHNRDGEYKFIMPHNISKITRQRNIFYADIFFLKATKV